MAKQKKLTEEQNINDVKKFNSDYGLNVILDKQSFKCPRCKTEHYNKGRLCSKCWLKARGYNE